jgi:hypothetical protein
MIEDDIRDLQEIVRGLHGRLGHRWYRGDCGMTWWFAECACGESTPAQTAKEYFALPSKYDIDARF